jgi:predicted nucleic acid-binding protein
VTPAEVVLDASVAVRGLLRREGAAAELVDGVAAGATAAHAPDLIVPEVTNALRMTIDVERWSLEAAQQCLDVFLGWPLETQSSRLLAPRALDAASSRGISAYGALYAVLAEALEVPLVTADRRLANAVPDAVLMT